MSRAISALPRMLSWCAGEATFCSSLWLHHT